jgi:hypothetical protein
LATPHIVRLDLTKETTTINSEEVEGVRRNLPPREPYLRRDEKWSEVLEKRGRKKMERGGGRRTEK